MILIAHRGHVNGPSSLENHPDLIEQVWREGYHAEIDVRFIDGQFWLGHDNPQYQVPASFLHNDQAWCHAKNFDAMIALRDLGVKHWFWHQDDHYTLTSSGYVWTFPGHHLNKYSIAVMPETYMADITTLTGIYGVCSDYVSKFR